MIWSSMEYIIKYVHKTLGIPVATHAPKNTCLLYTSDAADE